MASLDFFCMSDSSLENITSPEKIWPLEGRFLEHVQAHPPDSLAFFVWDYLGDVLTSLPLLQVCRSLLPNTQITLFTNSYCAPLLPFFRGYDKAHIIPLNSLKKPNLLTLWRLHRKFTQPSFDFAISAFSCPEKKVHMMLSAVHAKIRIGRTKGRWNALADRFINWPVTRTQIRRGQDHINLYLSNLRILFPLFDRVPDELYPRLDATQNLALPSDKNLVTFLAPSEAPILLISLSNNRRTSSLSLDHYTRLLNRLSVKKAFKVLISCLPDQVTMAKQLSSRLKVPNTVLATTQLIEFIAVLNRAHLVFVGDGGIMHLASALEKKCIALFGKTSVEDWLPNPKYVTPLFHPEHVNLIPEDQIVEVLAHALP